MALNSLPASRRLRSAQHMLRDARLGQPMTEATALRLEKVIGECAADVEKLELASGAADVVDQLRAAGRNPVMMRAVLNQAAARKAVRHG